MFHVINVRLLLMHRIKRVFLQAYHSNSSASNDGNSNDSHHHYAAAPQQEMRIQLVWYILIAMMMGYYGTKRLIPHIQ